MNPLDAIAPFYDLDFGDQKEDLEFYLNWARREGEPILEVGCGTGRVLVFLAQAGFRVTGVDNSKAFLEIAQRKLAGPLKKRSRLVQADVRQLALEEEFSLAIVALNTFGHLTSMDDQLAALERIHHHLKIGGLLILDLANPYGILNGSDNALVLVWVRPTADGVGTIAKLASTNIEPRQQLQRVTYFYDMTNKTGQVRRTIATFALKYCFPDEVRLLLDKANFKTTDLFGSYELDAFTPGSERMIVLARK